MSASLHVVAEWTVRGKVVKSYHSVDRNGLAMAIECAIYEREGVLAEQAECEAYIKKAREEMVASCFKVKMFRYTGWWKHV